MNARSEARRLRQSAKSSTASTMHAVTAAQSPEEPESAGGQGTRPLVKQEAGLLVVEALHDEESTDELSQPRRSALCSPPPVPSPLSEEPSTRSVFELTATAKQDSGLESAVDSISASDTEVAYIAQSVEARNTAGNAAAGDEALVSCSAAEQLKEALCIEFSPSAAADTEQSVAVAPDYETASRASLPPPRWLTMPPPIIPITLQRDETVETSTAPVETPAVQTLVDSSHRRRMPGLPHGAEADALRAWEIFRQAQSQRCTPLRMGSTCGKTSALLAVLPTSRPVCVRLDVLHNLPVPHAAAAALSSGCALLAQFTISMFDASSCAFFGATAVTQPVPLSPQPCVGSYDDGETLYTAHLHAQAYFHSQVADSRCLLVFDCQLVDPSSLQVIHEAGWAAIPLVQPSLGSRPGGGLIPAGITADVALRQGASRALLSRSHPRTPPLGFAHLLYGVHACPAFAPCCGLVPPNFVVTSSDVIPGINTGNASLEMAQLRPIRRVAIQSIELTLESQLEAANTLRFAVRITAHNGLSFCSAPVCEWLVRRPEDGIFVTDVLTRESAALEVDCPQCAQCALVWELLASPQALAVADRRPTLDAPVLASGIALVFGGGPDDDRGTSDEADAAGNRGDSDEQNGHLLRGSHTALLRPTADRRRIYEGASPVAVAAWSSDGLVATVIFEVDDANQLRLDTIAAAAGTPELSEEPVIRSSRRPRVSASCDVIRRSVMDAHEEQLAALATLHAEQLRAARATLDISDKTLGMVASQQARQLDALASQLRTKLELLEQMAFDDELVADSAAALSQTQCPVHVPSPPPGRSQSLRIRARQRHLAQATSDAATMPTDDDAVERHDAAAVSFTAFENVPPAKQHALPLLIATHSRSPSPIRALPQLAEMQRMRMQQQLATTSGSDGSSLMDADDPIECATCTADMANVRRRHKHDVIMATLRQGLQILPERPLAVRTRLAQRTFEVTLSDGLLKKIEHTNNSMEARTWHLRSSHPDLLTLSPEGEVSIPPGSSVDIALQFAPAPAWRVPCASADGVADVLVFINDAADNNEAVFRLRVRI